MDTFSFYGGPYTNNNGTLLYNRLTSMGIWKLNNYYL
jgi:hypothetical protein